MRAEFSEGKLDLTASLCLFIDRRHSANGDSPVHGDSMNDPQAEIVFNRMPAKAGIDPAFEVSEADSVGVSTIKVKGSDQLVALLTAESGEILRMTLRSRSYAPDLADPTVESIRIPIGEPTINRRAVAKATGSTAPEASEGGFEVAVQMAQNKLSAELIAPVLASVTGFSGNGKKAKALRLSVAEGLVAEHG